VKIKLTHSRQTIQKKYNTIGSSPVRVKCEDGNSYVCKYSVGTLTDFLFYEFLAASFLKTWALGVPDFKFVKVKAHHIDEDLELKKKYFEKTCFGLQYNELYLDINESFRQRPKRFYKRFSNSKNELLKICLFDIWMGHSDRTEDNFNLMYDSGNDYRLIPIDHQSIFFNGNIFHLNNYNAKYEDSLLSSFLPLVLFNKKELINYQILPELQPFFKKAILNCKQSLPEIVENIPDDWQLDKELYENAILNNLFSDEWVEKSWNDFINFYQLTINKIVK